MLNTEEQFETPRASLAADTQAAAQDSPSSAAAARVTAEEFTAAIEALEHRKAEESRRLANTVEVGRTIQDLHIDATPEDVMREVIAQRASRERLGALPPLGGAPPQANPAMRSASRDQLYATASMLKDYYNKNISPSRVQVGVPVARQVWRDRGRNRKQMSQWGFVIGIVAFMAFVTNSATGVFGLFSDEQKTFPQQMIAAPTPLSHLGEDESGVVDVNGLSTILKAGGVINLADQNVPLTALDSKSTFVIAKHGGKLYLEGYTQVIGMKGLTDGDVMIYSQDNAGELEGDHYDTVTVPLAGVNQIGSDKHDDWSTVTVSNIHRDAYTRSEFGF